MTELSTPVGSVPIAPASVGRDDVALWVIGVLFLLMALAVLKLWHVIREQREDCRKENEAAKEAAERAQAESKAAAAASQEKTEKLYQAALAEVSARETRLVEVVERNTAALHAIEKHVGSGYYRALREERLKGERGAG